MTKKKPKTAKQVRDSRREMHHSLPGSEARLERLNAAIALAGGIIQFAKDLDVKPQAVTQWRSQRFVSLERAVDIERLYGIPRGELVTPSVAAALSTPPAPRAALADII